jgi:hypothetical protein
MPDDTPFQIALVRFPQTTKAKTTPISFSNIMDLDEDQLNVYEQANWSSSWLNEHPQAVRRNRNEGNRGPHEMLFHAVRRAAALDRYNGETPLRRFYCSWCGVVREGAPDSSCTVGCNDQYRHDVTDSPNVDRDYPLPENR